MTMDGWLPRVPDRVARGLAVLLLAAGVAGCGDEGPPEPSGTLEATTVDVAPVLGGRIVEVRVDEGRRVARGDTLVVQDREQLGLELRQLESRRERLRAEREQSRQSLQQAQRNLELAATTLERTRRLREQGSATEQQVDDLEARRDVAASQVQAARDRLAALAAESDELDAGIALQHSRLDDAVLLAPRDAVVLLRIGEPGEVGRVGQPVLRLADLDTLELRVYLQEPDLDLVRLGDRLPVTVDARADRELTGTVSWISDEAEFTPKNVQTREARAQLVYAVELRVPNPGDLHVGMPASVRVGRREEER